MEEQLCSCLIPGPHPSVVMLFLHHDFLDVLVLDVDSYWLTQVNPGRFLSIFQTFGLQASLEGGALLIEPLRVMLIENLEQFLKGSLILDFLYGFHVPDDFYQRRDL
jgi:hypothetical protein